MRKADLTRCLFAQMIAHVLSAHVSCMRVEDFLNQEETGKYSNITTESEDGGPRVGFKDATLSYASKEEAEKDNSLFCLRDLNLDFPEGELSIIAGSVGSGKVTAHFLSFMRGPDS